MGIALNDLASVVLSRRRLFRCGERKGKVKYFGLGFVEYYFVLNRKKQTYCIFLPAKQNAAQAA